MKIRKNDEEIEVWLEERTGGKVAVNVGLPGAGGTTIMVLKEGSPICLVAGGNEETTGIPTDSDGVCQVSVLQTGERLVREGEVDE